MNKTPIFVVTTIRHALRAGSRSVGFFHEFKHADEAVRGNDCDLNECGHYPFAVIEETDIGIYSYPRKGIWYKWNRDKEVYEQIAEKPERFQQICGWGLG